MDKHWIWSLGFLLVGEGVALQTEGDKALQMCFVAAEEVFAHFLQALTASRAFRCLQVTWRPQADPDPKAWVGAAGEAAFLTSARVTSLPPGRGRHAAPVQSQMCFRRSGQMAPVATRPLRPCGVKAAPQATRSV